MFPIPPDLQGQFEEHLAKRMIPNGLHGVYKKWLRYYLDFRQKYHFPPTQKHSLPRFIRKLQSPCALRPVALRPGVGPRHVLDYSALRSQKKVFSGPISSFSASKRAL